MASRIMAEQHDTFGIQDVTARIPALHQAVHGRRVAHAIGNPGYEIRSAEQVHKAAGQAIVETDVGVATGNCQSFRPVQLYNLLQPGGDVVHGLVPGDLLPLTSASFSNPLQGMH